MLSDKLHIILAEDDKDDCLIFKEALEELEFATRLTCVHDGEQLMSLLTKNTKEIYNVLFLDINMPRKDGFTCLEEIKSNEKLKSLPVIVLSTSYDLAAADLLYKNGALLYASKPVAFSALKKIIHLALVLACQNTLLNPLANIAAPDSLTGTLP